MILALKFILNIFGSVYDRWEIDRNLPVMELANRQISQRMAGLLLVIKTYQKEIVATSKLQGSRFPLISLGCSRYCGYSGKLITFSSCLDRGCHRYTQRTSFTGLYTQAPTPFSMCALYFSFWKGMIKHVQTVPVQTKRPLDSLSTWWNRRQMGLDAWKAGDNCC